jgi:hypothetical protein
MMEGQPALSGSAARLFGLAMENSKELKPLGTEMAALKGQLDGRCRST